MTVLVLGDDPLVHMALGLLVGEAVELVHAADAEALNRGLAGQPTTLILDAAAQAFDPAEFLERCLKQHKDLPTVVIGILDGRLQSILATHPQTLLCKGPHEDREAIVGFLKRWVET